MTLDLICDFSLSLPDDLADDLGDVDFDDPGNADDEGWETEDEMEAEAEQDDSELTFSKHTGSTWHCFTMLLLSDRFS